MSTVFVTQIPSRMERGAWVPTVDISPAKAFGNLRIIIPSGLNFASAEDAIVQLRGGLQTFNPEKDYLVPLGDPTVMVVAAAILGREHNSFRLLKWDRDARQYFPYEVEL